MSFQRTDALIPFSPGQAIGRGWTSATDFQPVGITWHWTATRDLALCRAVLGGANAERRGEASAHYGIGRTFEEGVDRYVSIEDRSWHAGINQTLRWDGKALQDNRFKATRTTIGVETVCIGFARSAVNARDGWIQTADPTGKHVMLVEPWTPEQVEMIIAIGKEIVTRWPGIGFRDHHGHHDICPGYKQDVAGFPFAQVLRGIYDQPGIPDVWTPVQTPLQRQNALLRLGYDLGRLGADGDWGRFSDAALRRFQRDN
jgi:N-acetyl-anhydromuramyl-L-alanine amidase AmpD